MFELIFFIIAYIFLSLFFKDTVLTPGCMNYNSNLPTYPTTTVKTTTANPCGEDFTCSTSPLYCIKQSQVI